MEGCGRLGDVRRLLQALAAGAFLSNAVGGLPQEPSVFRSTDRVFANHPSQPQPFQPPTLKTLSRNADTVEMTKSAKLNFAALRKDAVPLTNRSCALTLAITATLRFVTGVFGEGRPARIIVATATMGIRA